MLLGGVLPMGAQDWYVRLRASSAGMQRKLLEENIRPEAKENME